jgi:spore germination protein GerM
MRRIQYIGVWLAVSALLLMLLPHDLARAQTAIAEPFREYYEQHQGLRLLGRPLSGLTEVAGYPAQYFEKGRLEDHRVALDDPDWNFMYGRITVELLAHPSNYLVCGTGMTYVQLSQAANPLLRQAPPADLTSGTKPMPTGMFVPYDAQLRRAPGYIVPSELWAYITRADLFPSGWLHDTGLPLTHPIQVKIYKQGELREITLQAFERTVLTYDPKNQPEWRVERANIGMDAVRPAAPLRGTIDIPVPKARVTLPLHILAHAGRVDERVSAVLRWEQGVELAQVFSIVRGSDGRSLLIGNLDWTSTAHPEQPWTQPATLQLRDSSGAVLAQQQVTVLHPDDPDTRAITLYWVAGETLRPETRHILRTGQLAAAVLNELLWGPTPGNEAGFRTALPTPEEVLRFSGRGAGWESRVTLRSFTLTNGMACADFSPELRAYGGGALRASRIHGQITRTLLDFREIKDVCITIGGQIDTMLEPQ